MAKWLCPSCGFTYDETEPDPSYGMDVPLPFDEHPADWVCPDCGAVKDDFKKVDEKK